VLRKITEWLKGAWYKMIGKSTLQTAIGAEIAVSEPMLKGIEKWAKMYENAAPWLSATVKSLNLPAAIAGEIARIATIEMSVELTGSARADFLAEQLEPVIDELREQVEYGAALGGLVLKPFVDGDRVMVDYVRADSFFPLEFDSAGEIRAAVFVDQRKVGDNHYTRLELHRMTAKGCEIRNQAFRSTTSDTLGQPTSLGVVPEWAELAPQALITGIDRPLFAYFRYPIANNIDRSSKLGVSCYARAADLIQQADEQWSVFLWEMESGQRALYVDLLAFSKDSEGRPILPNKRLYKTLDTGGQDEALFEDWSPDIRQEDMLAGLDATLKRIEYLTGLAYGTLSDPQLVEKTATEIATSKQRTHSTVVDTQKALRHALERLIWAMDVWVTIDRLAPLGAYEAAYVFDDSIIVDSEMQFSQDLQLVRDGIMSKVEWRMRNFRESEEVALEKIAAARAEQPEVDPFGFGANA